MLEQSSLPQAQKSWSSQTGFVAGTLVHTRDGLRAIEDIRVGDWVMTNAEDAIRAVTQNEVGEPIYRQVLETFFVDNANIVEIRYVQPDGEYGFLSVTPHHPIMIKGRGWTLAGELKYGQPLMLGYFGTVLVGKNKPQTGSLSVHNIKVDEFRSYFVGKYGVWAASI